MTIVVAFTPAPSQYMDDNFQSRIHHIGLVLLLADMENAFREEGYEGLDIGGLIDVLVLKFVYDSEKSESNFREYRGRREKEIRNI